MGDHHGENPSTVSVVSGTREKPRLRVGRVLVESSFADNIGILWRYPLGSPDDAVGKPPRV